jgi:hypothetical protein
VLEPQVRLLQERGIYAPAESADRPPKAAPDELAPAP